MKMMWKYALNRFKTVFKNYNVAEKAEKVLETEKRAPPRHPGTEVKFQVLIKGNPGIKEELEKKDLDLLKRLKVVKVNSDVFEKDPRNNSRLLPQERQVFDMPKFGYTEPKIVPENKCTLGQALEFISKHQNDPGAHSIENIAKDYSMKSSDVENIVTHFRAFELYISRESKTDVSKDLMNSLGVGKVIKPLFRPKFAHLEKNLNEVAAVNESEEASKK